MYISETEYEGMDFEKRRDILMPSGLQEVLGLIVEEGCGDEYGFWAYNGQVETAIFEDTEGMTSYCQFDCSLDEEAIANIAMVASKNLYERYSCSCYHDCCGCSFPMGVSAAKMISHNGGGPGMNTYILKESWGRNV